jgi:hypothetical protein
LELADQYDNITDVPPEHAALYTEKDGKAVLSLDGIKTQDDFNRYGEALKKRYAEQAAKGAADAANLDLDNKDIKRVVAEAMKEMQIGTPAPDDKKKGGVGDDPAVHELRRELASVKSQLEEAQQKEQQASATAQATQIKTSLQGEAAKSGIRPEAIDALVSLISDSFELAADGTVVVKLEGNRLAGVTPNSSPGDVLSILKRDANYGYFWPESKGAGGGSGGGGGGGGASADNPWSKAGWNLTKQGAAVKADRAEAERLAKQAGSFIGASKPPE